MAEAQISSRSGRATTRSTRRSARAMVLINPLQLAVMPARLATGKLVMPRLLKSQPVASRSPDLDVDPGASGVHPQGDVAAWSITAPRPAPSCRSTGSRWPARPGPRRLTISASASAAIHQRDLEAARPCAVHRLRAGRQAALRDRLHHRAWRLRRRGRRADRPRHHDLSCSTSRRRSRRSQPLEQSNGAARWRSATRARPPLARGQRPAAAPPTRHDHLGDHPAAARAAAVALDLPGRRDRRVRPDRPLFGRRRIGRSRGRSSRRSSSWSSSASPSACRG